MDIPPFYLMCKKHWFQLPPAYHAEIKKHYRAGQERDKKPSKEYIEAVNKARAFLAKNAQWEHIK